MWPHRDISFGVVTMISLHTGKSANARRISIAVFRLSEASEKTTSRSISLCGFASPRAWEPKRIKRIGWKFCTIRSVIVRSRSIVVIGGLACSSCISSLFIVSLFFRAYHGSANFNSSMKSQDRFRLRLPPGDESPGYTTTPHKGAESRL